MIRPGRTRPLWPAALLACAAALAPLRSGADDIAAIEAEVGDILQRANGLAARKLRAGGERGKNYTAERLADGESFYRLKDYPRAAIVFMDLVESFPADPVYPDALYYLADSLFLSRDYYGARDAFSRVIEEAGRPGMQRFRVPATGRLIEVAIHLRDFAGVEKYLDQLGSSPSPEASYIKGKYYYFKGDLERARDEFGRVADDAELELKAAYFRGAILTRQGRLDEAIAAFAAGRAKKTSSQVEREVLDLINLGLGRLYYEKDRLDEALAAYALVEEYSLYYDMALYEAASAKVRAGDRVGAERLLEVLTLAVPDSKLIPRAKLLRGNLLLHADRYDEAEVMFKETIGEFTPVRDQLEEIAREPGDVRGFFSALMERSFTALDVAGALPPVVVKWVGEEPDVQRALGLAADVGTSREGIRETERLTGLIGAVIGGPSQVNAFPVLHAATRRSQVLENRLGQLRVRLLRAAKAAGPAGGGEGAALAAKRQKLGAELAALPTSEGAYDRREARARAVYVRMKRELARNELRMDGLNATIVALEQFSGDPRYTGGVGEEKVRALREELERHRAGIAGMREELAAIRDDVERARYAVGIGDAQDRADGELLERARRVCGEEGALIGGDLGARVGRVLARVGEAEAAIARFRAATQAEAARQMEEIARVVAEESAHVERYRGELAALAAEAEEVIGGVTFENFSGVRRRFHNLILKADVGVADVSWMRKEKHKQRGASFNKERLREIQDLDRVFDEVKSGSALP